MNKIFIIGNLTADPELRATPRGTMVCAFSVAVKRKRANGDGEKITDFFKVIAWSKLAEVCERGLQKGSKCAVIGSVQIRPYQSKGGEVKYATEIIADEIDFLSPRPQIQVQKAMPGFPDLEQFGEPEDP